MFLIDMMLVLAILFFLFLPITDRRTSRMKLYMLFALLSVFTVSVSGARAPEVQVASIVATR